MSMADAGVLFAIQEGYNAHTQQGFYQLPSGNERFAAQSWKSFFDQEANEDTNPSAQQALKEQWGESEQAGVNAGGGTGEEHSDTKRCGGS